LDEFGELHWSKCQRRKLEHLLSAFPTRVTSFTGEGHEGVCVQRAGLVVFGFQDGGTSHGGFGRGDEGEVFPRDSQ
jgi:hypothetical protein